MPRASRSERRLFVRCILVGLAMTFIVAAVEKLGLIQRIEDFLYDERSRLCQRTTPTAEAQVFHIDLDDSSLDELGPWPWKRSVIADVIDELHVAGAKLIALDVLFAKSQNPEDDKRLEESVRRCGHV